MRRGGVVVLGRGACLPPSGGGLRFDQLVPDGSELIVQRTNGGVARGDLRLEIGHLMPIAPELAQSSFDLLELCTLDVRANLALPDEFEEPHHVLALLAGDQDFGNIRVVALPIVDTSARQNDILLALECIDALRTSVDHVGELIVLDERGDLGRNRAIETINTPADLGKHQPLLEVDIGHPDLVVRVTSIIEEHLDLRTGVL